MFDQALFDDEEVAVLSIDGGRRIAAALGNKKFCILRNHGLLTVGRSVEESHGWFVMAEQVAEVEATIRRKGYYPLRMSVERLHELDADADKRAECFQEVMLDGVERWMGMASEKLRGSGVRCFVCPGNDAEMEVDEVVRRSDYVELGEGRIIDVDGFSMIRVM